MMENGGYMPNEELMELLGKLVGRLEENSIALNTLVSLLEDKGVLRAGELDKAIFAFLRDHGREYFVEVWGPDLGEGLCEGLALSQMD